MIQSKALDMIGSFSKKEISEFEKYLLSPYLTSNKKLLPLFRFIKKYTPDLSDPKFNKESAYYSVYGKAAFNYSRLRKLLSDLYKETERFTVVNNILKNESEYYKILTDELDSRSLEKLFLSALEKYNHVINETAVHYDYFLNKHLAEWKNVLFHLERGMQHKIALNVYKRTEYLIFYFLSDFFLSIQDMHSNHGRFNIKSSKNLADEFLKNLDINKLFEFISKHDFDGKDVLTAYYMAYKAFSNFNNIKYYYEYKKFISEHLNTFNEGTQRTTVIYLINYCGRKKRFENSSVIKNELIDNYGIYIKYGLYKISGENFFRSDLFLNIVSNYFEAGKSEEAEEFVKENIGIIQPTHRKNVKSLFNALHEFEKGNFGDSLRETSLIKTNTFLYKYKIKFLNLKNHFELNNYEIAKESVNSFRKFLNTDKNLQDEQRTAIHAFFNYYNALWSFREGKSNQKSIIELFRKIPAERSLPESDWLSSKFNALIKRIGNRTDLPG